MRRSTRPSCWATACAATAWWGWRRETIPLVVPRAHDCITLFLGSKERYLDYFQKHPGVYFKTSGWIERGEGLNQYRQDSIEQQSGMTQTYEELVAKYGEDNAKFLYEQLCNMTRNYSGLTFIEMGIEPDDRFERQARRGSGRAGLEVREARRRHDADPAAGRRPVGRRPFSGRSAGRQDRVSFDEKIIKAGK